VRTGAKVVTVINIIGSVLGMVGFIIGLFVASVVATFIEKGVDRYIAQVQQIDDQQALRDWAELVSEVIVSIYSPFMRSGIGIFGADLGLSVLCLVGLLKNRAVFVLPWLIVRMFRLVIGIILVNGIGILFLVYGLHVPGGVWLGVGSLVITIEFIHWKVVQSEYIHVGNQEGTVYDHQQQHPGSFPMQQKNYNQQAPLYPNAMA